MKKILIIFVLMTCSCSHVNSEMSDKLQKKCSRQSNDCIVYLKDIVTEDWDYVLISTQSLSLEDLNSQLGFEYPYFKDIARRIIFVKGNKIIYHEDKFPNPEQTKEGEVFFDIGNNNFIKIEREKAVFRVVKEGDNYTLTQYYR